MAAAAKSAFGKIDILVNNAGCNVRKRALEVTWEDWNLILETNLRGTFFVSQAVARFMIEARYGRIINIGSETCVAGYAGLAPYGASRGGVKQITMSLAHDWGEYGITVNCLAPGWFKTAQNAVIYEDTGWVEYLCERIPLGVPAPRMTWMERSSSLPPKKAAMSRGRHSWWMAGFPLARCGRCP